MDKYAYPFLRPDIRAAFDDWAINGREHGSFVMGVLENDFGTVITRADDENGDGHALRDAYWYVYNELPRPCWGNAASVKAWAEKREAEGPYTDYVPAITAQPQDTMLQLIDRLIALGRKCEAAADTDEGMNAELEEWEDETVPERLLPVLGYARELAAAVRDVKAIQAEYVGTPIAGPVAGWLAIQARLAEVDP